MAPEDVAPIAINFAISLSARAVWALGLTSIDTKPLAGLLTPPVTVIMAVAEIAPGMLAVSVAVPAETAVTSPVELMVALAGAFDAQVTIVVTSWVLGGCLPWVMMPVALNCAVWPAARAWVAGVIWMVLTPVLLPHPPSKRPRPANSIASKQKRFKASFS